MRVESAETEILINPYLEYTGKPIILGPVQEIDTEVLHWLRRGSAVLKLPSGESLKVPASHQQNCIESTLNALLGNLTPGSQYEETFNAFREGYEEALINSHGKPDKLRFGELVYYPLENDLVWFAPRDLKLLAWLARNEIQLKDPEQKISWEEQRRIFEAQVIGVVGGSVGSNIFKRVNDTLKPSWLKIADPDSYDDANRNRSVFGHRELGVNKAEANARMLHQTDPWLPISVYSEGVHPENIRDFLLGNDKYKEPPATGIVDVCDDPVRKIEIGQQCRANGIPLWRLTDFGKTFQVEYFPYRDIPDFPLAIGVSDDELVRVKDNWRDDPANRSLFFDFAFALVGNHWRHDPEFAGFINQQNRTPFTKGIPQTSIASEAGASHVALHMASVMLGWEQPNRFYVDLRSGTQIAEYLEKHFNTWVLFRDTQNIKEGTMTHEVILVDSDFRVELTRSDRSGNVHRELFNDGSQK